MQDSKNFKQLQSIVFSDSITSLDASKTFLGVGCLDDSVHIWKINDEEIIKREAFQTHSGNAMGIVDLSFNSESTSLVTSCMDSTLRIFDISDNQIKLSNTIECEVMTNWKVESYNGRIYTGGDSGIITPYQLVDTKMEKQAQIRLGNAFLTALAQPKEKSYFAAGNNNGDVFIQNSIGEKVKIASFKPHHKLVRQLAFIDDDNKLLTASDDATIKVLDVPSEKVSQTFEGHRISVSSVDVNQAEPRLFYSTSFDKTVKCWDLRQKSCIATAQADSPLWDCKSIGKTVYVGGESGKLNLYSLG